MKKVSQIWYPKTQVSTQVAPLVIPSQFFAWKLYKNQVSLKLGFGTHLAMV
jgi:hypothetical protein